MSVIYGDTAKQRKYDAWRIIEASGQEPIANAVSCALRLRKSADHLEKALESASEEDRAKLALALAKCVPDEFHAWIKIAEFVYAKPKQALEVSGSLTLEQILASSWEKPIQPEIQG